MVRTALITWFLLASASAHAATYSTYSDGCESLPIHQPSDDVHVKDGIDAKGWAVAPADLDAPSLTKESFDPVGIALDVPMSDYVDDESYNYNADEAELWLGRINVQMDGRVDFNGQPLNTPTTLNPDCAKGAKP